MLHMLHNNLIDEFGKSTSEWNPVTAMSQDMTGKFHDKRSDGAKRLNAIRCIRPWMLPTEYLLIDGLVIAWPV